MNSENKVHPGSKIIIVDSNAVQTTTFKNSFIQFLYMSLECLIWRPVVMMFQKFFPVFYYITFPLIINCWFIFSWCSNDKNSRSALVLNLWTFKITIFLNRVQHRTFRCRSVLKWRNYQWLGRRGPAQYVHFFNTRFHLSELPCFNSIISTDFFYIFIFK